MAYQRDYILKMIEMMGDLIAALLGKIKKGETKIAAEQIEQYYNEFLKQDAAFFSKIPIDNLTDTLLNEHNYTNEHLQILAELFYAEGELYLKSGKIENALLNLKKSLKLNEYIDATLKTFDLKRNERIILLQNKIKEFG